MHPMPVTHVLALPQMAVPVLLIPLLLAGAGPGAASPPAGATPAACIDRSLYPGSERLSDEELQVVLEEYADLFPPFSRVPHWVLERAELLAARRHAVILGARRANGSGPTSPVAPT